MDCMDIALIMFASIQFLSLMLSQGKKKIHYKKTKKYSKILLFSTFSSILDFSIFDFIYIFIFFNYLFILFLSFFILLFLTFHFPLFSNYFVRAIIILFQIIKLYIITYKIH